MNQHENAEYEQHDEGKLHLKTCDTDRGVFGCDLDVAVGNGRKVVLVIAYLTIVILGALLAWGGWRLTKNRSAAIRWFIASLPIGLSIPIVIVGGPIPVPCPVILVLAQGVITGPKDVAFYNSLKHVGIVGGAVFALGMLANLIYFLWRIPNRNVRFSIFALLLLIVATIIAILLWITT